MTGDYVLWLVLAHAAGDYLLQSQWMAEGKIRRWWPAWVHAGVYGLAFIPLVPSLWAWLTIVGTHAVIDRFRVARYVVWAQNQLAPAGWRSSWAASQETGHPPDMPMWLRRWLLVVADNTLHVAINLLAVSYL